LDLISLASNITNAAFSIDFGRKGFATRGKEQEGRISYETGIARAMLAFQEAQISTDPQALILAEYTFITQEFQLCEKSDKDTINSLTKAIESFDDAFLALKEVEKESYKMADNIFPHNGKNRVNGRPLLSLKVSCLSSKLHIYLGSRRDTFLKKHCFTQCFIGRPKDSFHIACIPHRTRLQNILRTPGLDPIEKALLKQRFDNLFTAQQGYIEKQKKAMGK
jgi:hypothetical protein